MNERISAASSPGEIRVAVMRDDVLVEYAIWRPGAPDGVGDVYRGRVLAKVPAMGGWLDVPAACSQAASRSTSMPGSAPRICNF